MTKTKTITIPQADGATREITLSAADYRRVRDDRTLLDAVKPIAIIDVYRDGTRERVK